MNTLVARIRPIIVIFVVASIAVACGTPVHQSTPSHGLHWELVSRTPGKDISVTFPSYGWLSYNRCTRKVESYVSLYSGSIFSYPSKDSYKTLWYWNGSRWLSLKVSVTLNPGSGEYAWDSNSCKAVALDESSFPDYLNAKSHPGQVLNPTWMWDGSSWRLVDAISPAISTLGIMMVYDPATNNIVLNGQSYDPNNGTWSVPKGSNYQVLQKEMQLESVEHSYHPPSFSTTSSTWTFNGATWVDEHPVNSPPLIAHRLTTYDPATSTVVVFGGWTYPISYLTPSKKLELVYNTWLWNGVSWTMAHPDTVPHIDTYFSAMAYDPLLHGVVLYDTRSHQIWLWSGNNWQKLRIVGSTYPPVRTQPSMVFDRATGQFILAGGVGYTYKKGKLAISSNPLTTTGTWVLAGSPS